MTENAIVETTQEQLVNRTRLVDGCEVQTFGTEIVDCNILEAEAGTNGYHGGDSGCCTYLRIKDIASTQWSIDVSNDDGASAIEIVMHGDAELDTIRKALRHMLNVLDMQASAGRKRDVC